MTKTYKIQVDCANCANLCEKAAGKVPGVENVVINFMLQKMVITYTEGADENAVCKAILKACRRIEPDFAIEL